jgi:hypothetical protein
MGFYRTQTYLHWNLTAEVHRNADNAAENGSVMSWEPMSDVLAAADAVEARAYALTQARSIWRGGWREWGQRPRAFYAHFFG